MTNTSSTATNQPRSRGRRAFLTHLGAGIVGAAAGGFGISQLNNWWSGTQAGAPAPLINGISVPPVSLTTASGIRVHNIQTGYVAVKAAHRSYSGDDGGGIPAILTDPTWTEWLPINTWVIEHPEGVIVVDTGEDSRAVSDKGFFNCDPATAFIYQSFLRFSLSPDDEIGAQLRGLGIPPEEVRWVVQTHLHSDHMGGLKHFPNAEIIVSPKDYPVSNGALTCHYPDWMEPRLITFTPDDALPGFAESLRLTDAGDVVIVPTPGHSAGHQSVLLLDDALTYFFAGDVSFSEAQMLENGMAGIALDPAAARTTLATVQTYARATPTVYLPTHDAESRARLLAGQTVTVA